jgi:predicted nucleic acid-binding protein
VSSAIVDAGPLVAYFKRDDLRQQWSREHLGSRQLPLYSCDPVVSEACFLLRRTDSGVDRLMEFLERRIVTLDFSIRSELPVLRKLLRRYRSIPMSLADACLVRMSELLKDPVIVTLDSDFTIYRRHPRQRIPLLMPA